MADLTNELLHALGEDDFIILTEKFGGVRLFVPGDIGRSELPAAIGALRCGASFQALSRAAIYECHSPVTFGQLAIADPA